MHESIIQVLISTVTAFAFLILTIGRSFKGRIDTHEKIITETRAILFKEYATKNEVDTSVDRIIDQLNRIENKLDHKKDK